jgi:hypothetical protein
VSRAWRATRQAALFLLDWAWMALAPMSLFLSLVLF